MERGKGKEGKGKEMREERPTTREQARKGEREEVGLRCFS
jgi:hypothetical protein